ncbi:MAG TPA: PEGA domain-containing protein [Kofleriaceae bacterium]|nr:PEGA domain-containing protein [Kofleriaceae bacterium]
MARVASLVIGVVVLAVALRAQAQPAPDELLDKKIAVWRFDALGIDNEIVQRLETLFRMELDRLDKVPQPSRRDIERSVTSAEQNCTGEEKCLAAIGKRLGVEWVVTGTVGSLGDNYVLNIKVVDVATGKSQRIQSDPLRGSPDELIEGVRVAAYRLLAPQQIHGSLQIQSDLIGAEVTLDGNKLGKTPLANGGVIAKLPLGKHRLRVEAKSYDPFDSDVEVHFQKVSPVVVRLLQASGPVGTGKTIYKERSPIYTRPWFIGAVGVGVVALAVLIGASAGHVDCYINGDPSTPC